jgi:hypothetical protein
MIALQSQRSGWFWSIGSFLQIDFDSWLAALTAHHQRVNRR